MSEHDGEPRERPRFVLLLVAFVCELIVISFVTDLSLDVRIARIAGALVLLVAVLSIGTRRSVVVALFVAAFAAQVVTNWAESPLMIIVSSVLRFLFLGYVTGIVVAAVFRGRRVTMDTLAGAACTYVLLGMVWANLYVVIEVLRPGSFDIPPGWVLAPGHVVAPLTYFSFSTLTTVGYVMHPVTMQASMLSVLEAIIGQLYLAIMIGRIVGLHTAQRSQ